MPGIESIEKTSSRGTRKGDPAKGFSAPGMRTELANYEIHKDTVKTDMY